MPTPVATTRLDLLGDDVAADPHPALAALRALGPVVWHEEHRRWLVTADREIRRLLADHRRCTVEGTTVAELFGADALISIDDPPRHNALRAVWADRFRPPAPDRLRPMVAAAVARLLAPVLARLRDGEAVDLSAALCRPLPVLVIAAMMGVDEAALPDVVRWSDAMASGGSAYLTGPGAVEARGAREDAKDGLAALLRDEIARRRANPGDDLVSRLVHAPGIGVLPEDHLVQNLRQLLFAGGETTAKWIGHILVQLAGRPDDRRALAADPSLIPAAADEVMRWAGVVGTLVRRVRGGPLAVAGVTLADGDALTLVLACGDRDPARYADPDAFDIRRARLPNLGFGAGLHHCLGAALARLEAELAIGAVLEAAPAFRIAGPCRYSALPLRGPSPVTVALER